MSESSRTGRVTWTRLPPDVRAAIGARCGAGVRDATAAQGGFSPGFAGTLTLDDGRRLFVKAGDGATNAETRVLYRREAEVAAALPAELAPRLHWWFEHDAWVVLAFEEVKGRTPGAPWSDADLRQVLAAQRLLADTPPPAGLRRLDEVFADLYTGWERLRATDPETLPQPARRWLTRGRQLERRAAIALSAGDAVVHLDLRSDNVLLTSSAARLVDWPHAGVGAPWADLVFFAPTVALEGGPLPGEVLRMTDVPHSADPGDLLAAVVGWAGRALWASRQPPPPGIPHLRAFQRAQADAALAWAATLDNS